MHTIAIANRKGGVGKSSVAANLAAALTLDGARVLVLDMDSQASATAIFLEDLADGALTTTQVLLGQCGLNDVILPAVRDGVFVAPAAADLTEAQFAVAGKTGRDTILRRAMRELEGYDVAIIDTAPEHQLATINSLVAATHVLMPFTPDPKALEGLRTTSEVIADITDAELARVEVLGCVQVAFDRRLAVTAQCREQVARAYGDRLFDARIRSNASFIVCPAWHRDIFAIEQAERAPRRGSEDYRALAAEVSRRLELTPAIAVAA